MRKDVDKEFIQKLGMSIRKARIKKGITMEELAFTCDVEYSQISRIERGLINTSVNTIHLLAQALDVEAKELFDFE